MRHRKRTVKLGRMLSHRKVLLENLAISFIKHKKIRSTVPKLKAVIPIIEKLIKWAQQGTLHARRQAYRILKDRTLVGVLFNEIVNLVGERTSGFTRLVRVGNRKGDGALLAYLELVTEEEQEEPAPRKKKKRKKREKEVESNE